MTLRTFRKMAIAERCYVWASRTRPRFSEHGADPNIRTATVKMARLACLLENLLWSTCWSHGLKILLRIEFLNLSLSTYISGLGIRVLRDNIPGPQTSIPCVLYVPAGRVRECRIPRPSFMNFSSTSRLPLRRGGVRPWFVVPPRAGLPLQHWPREWH